MGRRNFGAIADSLHALRQDFRVSEALTSRTEFASVMHSFARHAPLTTHHADGFQAWVTLTERFRSLFETTPDLVLIMDEAGLVVAANPSLKRILGFDTEELIGRPLTQIIPERYRARHKEGFNRYLATGVRRVDWKSVHFPGLARDGREIPLAISFGEFSDGGKRFFTGILRDVTAEKRISDALAFLARIGPKLAAASLDHESTLKRLTEMAVPTVADWCAVDVVTAEGGLKRLAVAHSDPAKVALASELARRYPADPNASHGAPHVVRTMSSELVSDIPKGFFEEVARDARHLGILESLGLRSFLVVPLIAHGTAYGAITLVQGESGRVFTEADVPLMEELGRTAGLAIHNATLHGDALQSNKLLEEQAIELGQQTEEAQALAEELEAQTDELRTVAEELREKTVEAEESNRAKSEFLASMSHELRTPLNAISGYVELLEMELRGPLTNEQRADLQRIKKNQNHLLSLINDVLNFAKVGAGKLEYQIETVALDQILKDCEAMVLPQIHAARISYSYRECGTSVLVEADLEKVRQILLNLLSNAIKFTPEGGRLIASCDQTEEAGRVRVTDTGIGIESAKLDAIFEPFVQVNRAFNQPGQGAGLGLAISRGLARAMGGDIVVESEPGRGSTFTFTVPLTNRQQE